MSRSLRFDPFHDIWMTAYRISLELSHPVIPGQDEDQLDRTMRKQDLRAFTDKLLTLFSPLDGRVPKVEVSLKLDRGYMRDGEGDIIEAAMERVYQEAGYHIGRARCIPLCWPEIEKIYWGYPRYGTGEEQVREAGDWLMLELRLTIPVLKP